MVINTKAFLPRRQVAATKSEPATVM